MARFNHPTKKTGPKHLDTHGEAYRAAHASGLAEWAIANGYVLSDGSPDIWSSRQRRRLQRMRDAEQAQTRD